MTTRNYSSRSQQTTLTGAVTAGATSMVVVSGTALLGGVTIPAGTTFTIVLDPDTALEEIVDATAVSTNTFTITRAVDGSSAQAHSAGAVVRHMAIGRDYREANTHIEASTGVHGISNSSSVVGTTDTQTLTNKTLTSPVITNPSISGAGVDASIVFEGATADAYETTLTVVDPTQDNTVTIPNTTGTVVIATATQTLTNKTLTSPVISGVPVITGLSSAGMISSSATPKDYVDSILGSATAAATSAASAAASATAAATSASSASASALASAASATVSANSATAAATSATSAALSATNAATSATSAAASATAASTSASSAATSASSALTSANSASADAITAAASVAAIAGYATSAANSASAAATSATSASNSATSAANSASAAATSAASAAISQSDAAGFAADAALSATDANISDVSASTSASSALTSANSASTSAASALTSANSAATSETNAATSASSASTSASSALTSATSAATTYDDFDDRYLGSKSSPPSVDNDGGALIVGAIYWNSTLGNMYVWSGSTWVQIATTSVYSAPTIGSTTIASGTTYTTIAGLTLDGGLAVADPTVALGLVTKQYVDNKLAGLTWKAAVNLRSTSNVSLTGTSGTLVIDGHAALVGADTGYRILLNGQTTSSEDGIYVYSDNGTSYTLSRSDDADAYAELNGASVYVLEGDVYGGTSWVQDNYTLSSFSGQTWVQFAASTVYLAGDGLTLTGTTFSVSTDYTNDIYINAIMGVL